MKKILTLLLSIISLSVLAQCDSLETPNIVTLTSLNLEKVDFQFCYEDSIDYLIISQSYNKNELNLPKLIKNANEGNYLLRGNKLTLFTTDNSRFQLKFSHEKKIVISSFDEVVVHSYYIANRNKLKLILSGNIESIEVVKEDEIQFFDITHTKAVEFYQMVFRYFKIRKWKN